MFKGRRFDNVSPSRVALIAMITRRHAALGIAAAGLAACGRGSRPNAADTAPTGSLGWAIGGEWRIAPARDEWRHPLQTLLFWGLEGDMTVLEVLPGLGWYTSILAPYLAANGGRLIAAGFDPDASSLAQRETLAAWQARFSHDRELYGDIQQTAVRERGGAPLAPANSVDLAIIANSVHTLMAGGIAERVFRDVLAALKPGGAFGVETAPRRPVCRIRWPARGMCRKRTCALWRRRRASSSSPPATSTPIRVIRATTRSASGRCRPHTAPRR